MAPASFDRIRVVKAAIAHALDSVHADTQEAASGCANVLMDIFADLIERGDAKVASEMRRMAERLQQLAAARADEIQNVVTALADSTPKH